jgi:NhaA family Na+:H+ antiporter
MSRVSRFAIEHLLLLPAGALLALVWANTRPESYFRFSYAMAFPVNDVAMVLFFGLITKEIVEATAPGGVLHSWRRVAVPAVAAFGAAVVAGLAYVAFVNAVDEPMLVVGWPIPAAVDIAVAYFLARLIFRRHPAIPFLLLLAIAADGLGFVALALYYPARDLHLAWGAVVMVGALGLAIALRRAGVKSFWPYVVGAGALSWAALYWGGFHPALALVPIMPFLPHAPRDPGFFVDARPGARDGLSQFELWARYPVHATLFLFGLVNAGVLLRGLDTGTWAVPVAALAGKPVGILLAAGLAVGAGLHLPPRVGWRELVVVGLLATIGFTLALFFATAIMAPGQLLNQTKVGVLVGLAGGPIAVLAAWLLRVGRFER